MKTITTLSKTFLAGCAVAAMLSAAPAMADTPQARWVGDVPIIPTLTIEKGLGFAFDNVDGRIVTIYLSGDASQAQMSSYYDQALEPLGWQKTGQTRWSREGEILEIKTTTAAGVALWKIALRPE